MASEKQSDASGGRLESPLDEGSGNGATGSTASHATPISSEQSGGGSSHTSSVRTAFSPSPPFRSDQPTVVTKRAPFAAAEGNGATDANSIAASLVGRRLDHFEIREFVGGGGMGAVFRALDTRLNRPVALKVLAVGDADDEALFRRFQNEAQSAARLDHENIARVFYIGSDQGFHYISFEFIEGINIRDLVARDGPLPLTAATSYVLQVADALAHACSRDVVHRDIKPSNVLLTDGGHIKLVDMGLARLDDTRESREDLTASGVTLGTFDYISPEQARDPRNADVRSDIYSLGCTFYFMLTGRPPFPDGTVLQKLLQHQGDSPADPRYYNPSIPEPVCRVLAKMLAKDPADRYRHPQDLIADLLMLADELELDLSAPANTIVVTTTVPHQSLLERHLPWVAPVVALLVIVAALELFSRLGSPAVSSLGQSIVRPPDLGTATSEAASNTADTGNSNPAKAAGEDEPISSSTGKAPAKFDDEPPAFPGDATNAHAEAAPPSAVLPPSGAHGDDVAAPGAPSGVASGKVQEDSAGTSNKTPIVNMDSSPPPVDADDKQTPSLPAGKANTPADDSRHSIKSNPLPANDASGKKGNDKPSDEQATPAGPVDGKKPPLVADTEPPSTEKSGPHVGDGEPSSVHANGATGAAAPDGLLIVNDEQDGQQHFATLADACAAARSGDVVELRFTGRRTEAPIELLGKDLTIRAGAGYQPQIEFRPDWNDAFALSRGMVTVARGRLTAIDVDFQLALPRDATADAWAMFDVQEAKSIRLRHCSLTIGNANAQNGAWHEDVAFFVVGPDPAFDDMLDDATAAPSPVRIELEDTCARGEAVFVLTDDLFPFHLQWDNGLLATSEHFLRVYGVNQPPRGDAAFQIDLRHVTARVDKGFCQLGVDADSAHLRRVQVACTDSIVMVDQSSPLIDEAGRDTISNLRRLVEWSGDHSFYEGFHVRWRLRGVDADGQPVFASLGTWKALANMREHSSLWGVVVWQRPPSADRAVHQLKPDDFLLDDRMDDNPALTETTDGEPAGCDPATLPVPADLSPLETSSTRTRQR